MTPVVDVPAKGEASGTTKSAIAEGTIEIRNNPDQDISDLSRTPGDALNVLGEIFDKQTVEEKQVMAKLFGEFAYRQIHIIAAKNGWDDGSPEKIALHAMVGGIMSDMTGAGFASGAAGAGLNEMVQKELAKLKDPSLHQIASGIIGAAAGSTAGAATAVSGTRNNNLLHQSIDILQIPLGILGYSIYLTQCGWEIYDGGNVKVAEYIEELNCWIDQVGDIIGNEIDDLYVWAVSKGELKRLPDKKIKELGGEDYTSELKKQTGKSKANLYWNPRTGEVYSIPRRGGEPQHVDDIEPRR